MKFNLLNKLRLIFQFKIWSLLKINFFPSYYSSHSQFGEDMVLRSLLENKKNGFYVDIGAHHPVYYSNTYHFYKRGWRGINIDAAPGSMELFKILRGHDKNLEVCIGTESNKKVSFYVFEKSALNTFDPHMAELASKNSTHISTVDLLTKTLAECLEENLPKNQKIDFLSIDVEGLDEAILRSNDWRRFSPEFIVFESHDITLANFMSEDLVKYLEEVGYVIVAKTGPSFIARLSK